MVEVCLIISALSTSVFIFIQIANNRQYKSRLKELERKIHILEWPNL